MYARIHVPVLNLLLTTRAQRGQNESVGCAGQSKPGGTDFLVSNALSLAGYISPIKENVGMFEGRSE
jgi:hypothetical protein